MRRRGTVGRAAGALGAVGVTTIAIEDWLRFSLGGVLVGVVPVALGALSFALLLFGASCSWRQDRALSCVFAALALQIVGRSVVASEPAGVFWAITAAHGLAPGAAVAASVVLRRKTEQRTVRLVAGTSAIVGLSWLVVSWAPVPFLLVPVSRSMVNVCLLVVIAWPLLLRVGQLARHLWDSADVR